MRSKTTPSQTWITVTVMACLAITGTLLYANALNAPFVFDDTVFLNDPHLLFTDLSPARIAGLSRITTENVTPRLIPNLTFALNYYFGRRHVLGYHLVNLLIHIVIAGLVFLVCRHTMNRCRQSSLLIPVLAALLWLANPLHVQSVTYIWQRMNSLGALFVMLTLYCYIKAREAGLATGKGKAAETGFFFAACLVSGVLALASKQNTAVLPILLVLYEWYFFQNLQTAWLKRQLLWICLAGLTGAGLALFYLDWAPIKTILETYANKSFTPGQRLLTEPQVVLYYITLLIFPYPSRLNLDIDFPVSSGLLSPAVSLPAVITLFALITGAAVTARKHRLLSFAIIWFLINLLIESSFIGLDLIYGYRTYLPSIFPFMALIALVLQAVRPRAMAVFLLAAAIILSGTWTVKHNTIWQSDVTLWQDIAKKSPLSARPFHNLGQAYKNEGACDRAVASYRKALKLRLATIGPDHYKTGDTWNNLGVAYDCRNDVKNAAESYEKALSIFINQCGPNHPKATAVYNNLCVLYGRNENFDRAVFWCKKALAARLADLGPDHPKIADLRNNLGLALAGIGLFNESFSHLNAALQLYRRHLGHQHPQTNQCRENLSHLLHQQQTPNRNPASQTKEQ